MDLPSMLPETVLYQTVAGTASDDDGDYIAVSGVLTIENTTTATISVPILGDLMMEPDEMFIVELSQSSGPVITDPIGEGTILNDDFVNLSVSDTEVVEGDQGTSSAVFTATLDSPSSEPVTARFATGDGSATVADADYRASSGMLRIPAGALSTTFSVPVNGDLRDEPNETFEVVLGTPMNATLVDNRGVATILNDDSPGPSISIEDGEIVEGNEGSTTADFALFLSEPSEATVSVSFATEDGSATTEDEDYLAANGTVVFQPGETEGSLSVEVIGDLRVEADETFLVRLSEPSGGTLGEAEATGTILNDDEPADLPTVSIGDVEVQEGDSGTVEAVFQLTLSAPGSAAAPVTVNFRTSDETANAGTTAASGDYQAVIGQAIFAVGTTSTRVVVLVNGDSQPELDETFLVILSEPRSATIEDGQGQGTIVNDDQAMISIGDATVTEGNAGTTRAVFPVTLTAASPTPVTVAFATTDGTATTADEDYQGMTGQVGFAAGQTTGTIAITVNGDTRQEADETFFVDLSNPTNATVADGRGQGTIRNDDVQPGTVVLRAVSPVMEGDGSARIEVERSGSAAGAASGVGPASVRLTTAPGTATAGEDFTPLSRTVTWDAGETGLKVVRLPIVDDLRVEGDETVLLRLSQPNGVALGTPAALELVIADDDTELVLQATGGLSLEVGVGEALDLVVQVTREGGGPAEGAEVRWTVEGDATLPNGSTSTSDAEGTARQQVQLGGSAGRVTVTAQVGDGEGQIVVFEIQAQGDLAALFDDDDPSGGGSVAQALDDACVDAQGELSDLCRYLLGLEDPARQREVLEELLPREVSAQATVMFEAAHKQLQNLRARQADLRSHRGSGPGSGGNLAMQVRGESIRLAALTGSRGKGRRAAKAYEETALSYEEMLAPELRQEMAKGADGEESPAEEIGAEFSRLGFFANGNLSFGDRPTSGQEAGFDFETTGLTVGLDYRLTDRFFFGGALGWLDTRGDVVADGGKLDVQGYSLLAYGSYYWQGFYVDLTAGFGSNDYDGTRNIDLAVPLAGQNRFVAASSTDGRQLSASLRVGYDRQIGATNLQGFGELSTVDLRVDAYSEQGGGPFDLTIGEQDARSLLAQGGLEAARAFSMSWGVLRPMVRGAFVHELEDDARQISARFTADRSAIEFLLPTDAPDRNYFNLAAGLTATFIRGRTLYLTYDRDVGRDDLDTETLAVGFRLEL